MIHQDDTEIKMTLKIYVYIFCIYMYICLENVDSNKKKVKIQV